MEREEGEIVDLTDHPTVENATSNSTANGVQRHAAIATVERPTVSIREILNLEGGGSRPDPGQRRRGTAVVVGVVGICAGFGIGALAFRPFGSSVSTGAVAPTTSLAERLEPVPAAGRTEATAESHPEGAHLPDGSHAATTTVSATTVPAPIGRPLTEAETRIALAQVGLQRITFVPHSIELTPQGDQSVREFAEVLKRAPGVPVEFVIHTYSEPTPGQNHGLSVEQGEFLRERLGQLGVETATVAATGVGSPDAQSQLRDLVLLDTASLPIAAVDTANLAFDPGTAALRPVAGGALTALAAAMATDPGARVNLVVYATTGAGGETDHALSHARGDRLVEELAAHGVDRARVSVVGLGATPVAPPLSNVVTLQVGEAALLSVALELVDRDSIDFVPHTTVLTPSSLVLLDQVAAALVAYPAPRVMVAGHTFTEASSDANHLLSQRQAGALAAYLASRGVDPKRFTLVGHGDPPQFGVESTGVYVTFTVIQGA